ncbi:MAG TPA: hypothetical protein VF710_07580 [Longimicrobium sp.]
MPYAVIHFWITPGGLALGDFSRLHATWEAGFRGAIPGANWSDVRSIAGPTGRGRLCGRGELLRQPPSTAIVS